MRILAVADVHCDFELFDPSDLPAADVCVIAGDLTNYGVLRPGESQGARKWLRDLAWRYPVVLGIPGNHDIHLNNSIFDKAAPNCHGIMDRTVEVGGMRFAGVSLTTCYDMPFLKQQWAYMTDDPEIEAAAFALLPPDVDVVVSHGPPHGILDSAGVFIGEREARHVGSRELLRYIEAHNPCAVICGHVHECRGHLRHGDTDVYNVAREWRTVEG